jgi:beta-fructofuranosidase
VDVVTLRLPDKWVWDFWLARQDEVWHIFYLQAPRALGDPALRHHNASIGHAISHDCREWKVLEDAILPGPSGSWDDLATWTGSVIKHDGRWYMLYTGICHADRGLVQRIGLVVSEDLVHWSKHDSNPVLEADPRWYELLDLERWRDQSWRDPYVFFNPDDGAFHVLVTARSNVGPSDGAGVIAHARSIDLVHWEVLPPITEPGEFAQVEVTQLVKEEDRCIIVFSCHAEDHSSSRTRRLGTVGRGGTFVLSAKQFEGPYSVSDNPVAAENGDLGVLYAGKILDRDVSVWEFMAFRGDNDIDFVGELTDPLPVGLTDNGDLAILVDRSIEL